MPLLDTKMSVPYSGSGCGFRRLARRVTTIRWWLVAATLGWAVSAAGTEIDGRRGAAQLYRKHCAACHGERGDGRTPARANLVPPPRDFTSAAARGLSRERMVAVVRDGKPGTGMVGWKTRLKTAEVEAVVDFIRAAFMEAAASPHPKKTGPATRETAVDPAAPMPRKLVGNRGRGEKLYAANCVTCHGVSGDGLVARAPFLSPRPRDLGGPAARARLNRPTLFAAIAAGKTGTDMPAWDKVLTEQEIADVAEYVYRAFARPPARR